jgi:hypothetical protein
MKKNASIFSLAACSTLLLTLSLTGCYTGNHTSPNVETFTGDVRDPNSYTTSQAITRSLSWVINKYPAQAPRSITRSDVEPGGKPASWGTVAVNLVNGTDETTYRRICKDISNELGINALPVTEELAKSNTTPIYHIGRIWIREQYARVDVFRPMFELPRHADGTPVYQCVTVTLRGWLEPYAVDGTQTREPGLIDVPPINAFVARPVDPRVAAGLAE